MKVVSRSDTVVRVRKTGAGKEEGSEHSSEVQEFLVRAC